MTPKNAFLAYFLGCALNFGGVLFSNSRRMIVGFGALAAICGICALIVLAGMPD